MSLENLLTLGSESPFGFKTVELLQGDITFARSDVLVVSAFQGGYRPTPGTIIGSLHDKHGLSLASELENCKLDFRGQFGMWITAPVDGLPFRRVLCVEMLPLTGRAEGMEGDFLQRTLRNVFVGLNILGASGSPTRTVALPVLGAGNQGLDPVEVILPLVELAREALDRSPWIERIQFVARNETAAMLLRQRLEQTFGHVDDALLPRQELVGALVQDIRATAHRLQGRSEGVERRMALELLEVLTGRLPSAGSIGLVARRLAETVTDSLYAGSPTIDLYRKIESLAARGVAPWVISYLHTLRVIGNEVVHIRDHGSRMPGALDDYDIAMCLLSIQRVVQFWLEARGYEKVAPGGTA